MADLKEAVNNVLLPVQLSLGLFQIMKTTPLWAVIHCALASLLNFFGFPYTDYKCLKQFRGRVFKKVISHTTTAGTKAKKQKDSEKSQEQSKKEVKSEDKDPETPKKEVKSEDVRSTKVQVEYLDKRFELERKDGNIMLMKDGPAYYITDKMWETVKYIAKVASKTVFVKDHKEIWEEVVTGDIMEFEQVLDSVILDNRAVIRLDNDYFLPVNLLMSEIKLTTTLNFVALFLKTQNHIHWLIPALLTFASVIMGFSTKLRLWISRLINTILCKSVQLLCDRLPLATRRWAYSWGNWVENFKPSNDLKSKIVRGSTILLVAAGAKLDYKSFADRETLDGGERLHVLVVDGSAKVDAESVSDSISVVVDGGAQTHLDCESLVDSRNIKRSFLTQSDSVLMLKCERIRVLVDGGAKAHLETLTDCKCLAEPVIMTDKTSKRVLLAKAEKAQRELDSFKSPKLKVECVHEISPKVGPFLFKCESKCDLKWNSSRYSVYIEWMFDIKSQMCTLKAGRVASQELLKPHDISIITGHQDNDCSQEYDKCPFRFPCSYGNSLLADDLDTSSVDVKCSSSEEAIKLLRFAFYMAKYKTTSLKSYDRKSNKVTVRRFVESINAYASSGYPPLYRLIMDDVVVR